MTIVQNESIRTKADDDRILDNIAKFVLDSLGRPADFQRVHVRPLWGDHYRVNVLVGNDSMSVTIAHSYFLAVDEYGGILASTPAIARKY